MNAELIKLAYRGIISYMAGREYKSLITEVQAETEDKLVKCRYKINGKWVHAYIDFSTRAITKTDGTVLRKVC